MPCAYLKRQQKGWVDSQPAPCPATAHAWRNALQSPWRALLFRPMPALPALSPDDTLPLRHPKRVFYWQH